MTPSEELFKLRREARRLRQRAAVAERTREAQRTRADKLEKKLAVRDQRIKTLTKEKENLQNEVASLKSRLNLETDKAKKYAGMIFKSSVRKLSTAIGRGGKPGHPGNGRRKPAEIECELDVHLTHCDTCGTPLDQTTSFDERIVEDIPETVATAIRYRIQRQWCTACRKEVRGIPRGTIPGARFGINTLALILTLKYRLRTPLEKIAEILETQYSLSITSQGIQELLHTTKRRFGKQYGRIIDEIRNAPVKHGDETHWRVNGVSAWCWLFSTQTAALYTIEETRGKEVPQRFLGHDPTGVLVRDDYAGYVSLPMPQQSCWAHLLRVSHEAAEKEGASEDMKLLHRELAQMFQGLERVVRTPFNEQKRQAAHRAYAKRIQAIIARTYAHDDAKAVQTRIANQTTNLITALRYEHVPLTNNHAERMIRPMVVTRKISGGSQSDRRAATHAVNMSVMQNIALKGQSFLKEVTRILYEGNPRYALGNS